MTIVNKLMIIANKTDCKMTGFNITNSLDSTAPQTIKRAGGTLLGAAMALTVSMSAQAILPTPDDAVDTSTSTQAMPTQTSSATVSNGIQIKTVAALYTKNAQGSVSLSPIEANTRLSKGNVIEYRSYFTNTNPDPIRSMTVTIDLPNNLELVEGIEPRNAFASVDGTNFGRVPLRGNIKGQVQDIPLNFYKRLRWNLEGLGKNKTTVVTYRGIVR